MLLKVAASGVANGPSHGMHANVLWNSTAENTSSGCRRWLCSAVNSREDVSVLY